ncbi:hypothetical protein PVAND_000427 [Polypedilum vanderplanki]|uniref:Cysteine-rich DPF motif domain-containing protein 1 n=1 Tax=Polypedilum vanderplanki TaxID=319348 RepID=A0A9J6BJT1_POLVA|nr:hypothetical protein PVAND_000427 [Polypedilum vanderplanki]
MEIGESSKSKATDEQNLQPAEKIPFLCRECKMSELVHYYGSKPPFVRNIEFLEDCYVMKDPFSAPPLKNGKRSYTEYFLVIGSKCKICEEDFCKDCSIFYSNTFCIRCAHSQVSQFPVEIQSKIRKEFLAIKNDR